MNGKRSAAEIRAQVREEFRLPKWEAVKAAAFMEVIDIARAMEVDKATAEQVRRAARHFIRHRWAFEEGAGER
ncbi:MAG: hypothetical protein LIP77_07095 [Planctomycetes bacterium]|nr:hypothetical protein [Planctomycetota bacterium]